MDDLKICLGNQFFKNTFEFWPKIALLMSCWVFLMGLSQEPKFLQSHYSTLQLSILPFLYTIMKLGHLSPFIVLLGAL